jgi:hypothetical protein
VSASGVYTLQFSFECLIPVRVSVHWLSEEVTDDDDSSSSGRGRIAYLSTVGQESAPSQLFPKGRHVFSLPPEFALHSAGLTDAQLKDSLGAFYYPLVVVMEEAEPHERSRSSRISHLTTYCSLQRSSSSSSPSALSVKVLRTSARVEPDGLTFEVQEVYGMKGETSNTTGSTAEGHGAGEDEEEKAGPASTYSTSHATIATPNTAHVDCLVCMSEPRDTALIPCRHFCVCSDCARTLKQQTPPRCPVCRTPIQTTIKIPKQQ